MMKMMHTPLTVALLALSTHTLCLANTVPNNIEKCGAPDGFYAGISINNQWTDISGRTRGTVDTTDGFPPLSHFSGQSNAYSYNTSSLSGSAKIGYLHSPNQSNGLYGIELSYQGMPISTKKRHKRNNSNNVIVLTNNIASMTDDVYIQSEKTKISHILLMPLLIGYDINPLFLTTGIGPALLKANHDIRNITDAHSGNIIGTITRLKDDAWKVGLIAHAGAGYRFSNAWFATLNYSFLTSRLTSRYHTNYSESINNGLNQGSAHLSMNKDVRTHTLSLSINMMLT